MWKVLLWIGFAVGGLSMWMSRGAIDHGLDRLASWKLERAHVKADEESKKIEQEAADVIRSIDEINTDGPIDDVLECMLRLAGKDREAKRVCDAVRKRGRSMPPAK